VQGAQGDLLGLSLLKHHKRIHAALERLSISGPVEEPRRDPQSTILIASNPSVTNLVNLALQFNRPTHQRMPNAACALAEPG
jgi:hypothetical protein